MRKRAGNRAIDRPLFGELREDELAQYIDCIENLPLISLPSDANFDKETRRYLSEAKKLAARVAAATEWDEDRDEGAFSELIICLSAALGFLGLEDEAHVVEALYPF